MDYRKQSPYDEEYNVNNDDDEETMKEFLPHTSIGNGDIRLTSTSNKHVHHSHSRRVPPIVLIPQQTHPLSTLTSSPILTNTRSHSHSHFHLFKYYWTSVYRDEYMTDRKIIPHYITYTYSSRRRNPNTLLRRLVARRIKNVG